MDQIIGNLIYKITGDTAALDKGLDISSKKINTTADSLNRLAAVAKRSFAAIATTRLIGALTSSASRVEELDAKFDTVFGDIAAASDSWARRYAQATSRGVTATKEMLASLQDVQTGYNDTTEHAARFSEATVGVANDLASFANAQVADVMDAIEASYNGMFRAMRTYGVSLTEEIINQQEYAKQLGKTYDSMTILEKREAVLSGIVTQSRNALHQNIQTWQQYDWTLGDAARTSDSFANTSQGFKQTLVDFRAELGAAFLPAVGGLLQDLTGVMKAFNGLPDPIQAATSATLAFAAALKVLGANPINIALSGIVALTVAVTSHKSASDKLAQSTRNLSAASSEYAGITKKLQGDTGDLTQAQRDLLEVQRQIAANKAKDALNTLTESYKKTSQEIASSTRKLNLEKAEQEAARFMLSISNLPLDELEAKLQDYIDETQGSTDTYLSHLNEMLVDYRNSWNGNADTLTKDMTKASKRVADEEKTLLEKQETLRESLMQVAAAANNGTIDISWLETSLPVLYKMIMDVADGMKTVKNNDPSKTFSTAYYASTQWSQALDQQRAAWLQAKGMYQEADQLLLGLSRTEQEEAIRKLATDAKLLHEGEDVNKLSIDVLRERIKNHKQAGDELAAMDEYYAMQRASILEGDLQTQKDASKEIAATLRTQNEEIMKAEADRLESHGDYQGWADKQIEILHSQRDAELALLQERVAKKEASAKDIEALERYYANEEVRINKEKDDKIFEHQAELIEAQAASEKEVNDLLWQQQKTALEASASELESNGQFEAAYMTRVTLLEKERDTAVDAMLLKVRQGKATEADLLGLRQYYAQEEENLEREKNDKIHAYEKKKLKERLGAMKSFASELKSEMSELASAMNSLYSNQTDAAVSAIDEQTRAQEEALGIAEQSTAEKLQQEYEDAVKAGDMELAQEKQRDLQRQQIEDEAEERKKKLQREQAKRDKELSIFQTILNTASAVVKFLADPGGFPGVALSAMAAATGAIQVAAIQAQPLPSYDVGAEKILQDQLAVVHKGETILPEPMAEAVRRGDAVYGQGGTGVIVEINNYSTSKVTADESADPDGSRRILVTIGKAVTSGIENGTYDRALSSRYGITRRGTNA